MAQFTRTIELANGEKFTVYRGAAIAYALVTNFSTNQIRINLTSDAAGNNSLGASVGNGNQIAVSGTTIEIEAASGDITGSVTVEAGEGG